ncbi:hypothetical protein [Halegenticoccus soli]|uniref:hypothetical protein n=1 Tax=Halegenticoccus soli TaxID=1985678 RepID=UPI000C6D16BA|nr:hypothetical protein [Halegenticoccus soli]
MADRCPYLEYRRESGGKRFETERAYCTAAEAFVQPMRADVCNDRYGLGHATDCEIFLEAEAGTDAGRD